MSVTLLQGDCLDLLPTLPAASVDMVLCDLPYGTTQNKWDSVIPFAPLWSEWGRLCRGAIVLFAAQPFTSALVMSNPRGFSYSWVWEKEPSGNLNAKRRPMAAHEDVLVFNAGSYRPQDLVYAPKKRPANGVSKTQNYGAQKPVDYIQEFTGYPKSIVRFPKDRGDHPTQKPVALLEYLIRTYTDEGATVLDNTMGSGSTGVACVNTGRNFIGIERDATYFDVAQTRIYGAMPILSAEEMLA